MPSGIPSPGKSCTSKISSTAVWNSSKAMTRPLRKSTTATRRQARAAMTVWPSCGDRDQPFSM